MSTREIIINILYSCLVWLVVTGVLFKLSNIEPKQPKASDIFAGVFMLLLIAALGCLTALIWI